MGVRDLSRMWKWGTGYRALPPGADSLEPSCGRKPLRRGEGVTR